MILYTVSAVLALGAGVVATALTPPASVVRQKALEAASRPLVQATDRSPASVGPQFSALAIDDKGTQALDFRLPCEGSESHFASNVAQVRISGDLCTSSKATSKTKKQELASSEITNASNGFAATLFYPKQNAFTTDYLTLKSGKNEIRIVHLMKSGARVDRTFTIQRD